MTDDNRGETQRTAGALRTVAVFSGAGFTLAAAIALGALGGNWLDHRLGTAPWLLVIGFLLGAIAGFIQLFRMIAMTSR